MRPLDHGLHRHVLPRAAGGDPRGRPPGDLRRGHARAGLRDMEPSCPGRGAGLRLGRGVLVRRGGRRLGEGLPGSPEAHSAPQLRHHRPRVHRGVRGAGRLLRSAEGAVRHDACRGHRGGQGLGSQGARRRGIPDRPQVVLRGRISRYGQVSGVQRRRGRPRRVHGPLGPRERPSCGAGGHDHRRQGHRNRPRLHLLQGRVPARDKASGDSPRRRARQGLSGR